MSTETVAANCQCRLCETHRRATEAIASRDAENLIAMVQELLDLWLHDGEDSEYRRAIMKGEWENSEQILEHALTRVRLRNSVEKSGS
jgi:hypothetical protein